MKATVKNKKELRKIMSEILRRANEIVKEKGYVEASYIPVRKGGKK